MITAHGLRAAEKPAAIIPTYISNSSTSAATGTSLTITTPTGALKGDLLVVNVLGSVTATWTAPAGWTMFFENGRYRGWAEYDGTTANYLFTTNTSAIICGIIMCIRNAAWDVNGANTAIAITNPIAPAITVTANDSLVYGVPCVTSNDGNAYSAPAGWTQRFQASTDTTQGSIAIFERNTLANPGTTGTVAFTRSAGSNTTSRAYLFSVKPKIPTATYIGAVTDTASLPTYTFTNANIGTADASRFVVVCTAGYSGSGVVARTVTSLTIGGVSATALVNPSDSNAPAMFGLLVPTGTTATIVVTFSGGMTFGHIWVYSVTNLNSTTPIDTDYVETTTSLVTRVTTSTQPSAVVICTGITGPANTAITGWTGTTPNVISVLDATNPASSASTIARTNTLTTAVYGAVSATVKQSVIVLR